MNPIGKRLFKLIDGNTVFGECYTVPTENGITEIQIRTPFTAKNGGIFPYMVDVIGSAPAAIQIHPMNILWQVPLDEFPEAESKYIEVTSGIVTEPKKQIIV